MLIHDSRYDLLSFLVDVDNLVYSVFLFGSDGFILSTEIKAKYLADLGYQLMGYHVGGLGLFGSDEVLVLTKCYLGDTDVIVINHVGLVAYDSVDNEELLEILYYC